MTGREMLWLLETMGAMDMPIKALDRYGFFHIVTEQDVSVQKGRVCISTMSDKPKTTKKEDN